MELIVVVAVIVIILGAMVPSLSSTWSQRRAADVESLVKGSILSARMKALGKAERGLFFVLDSGTQKIYEIVAEPFDAAAEGGIADEQSAANRFGVVQAKPVSLPSPYRVTPRSLVDQNPPNGPWVWDDNELVEADYRQPSATAQRQRNFFTIVFSSDGQLRVRRDVIIHDADDILIPDPDTNGDRTGLPVERNVNKWDDGNQAGLSLSSTGGLQGLQDVVTNNAGEAISFPSVDGLLVYDDSLFSEFLTPADKRDFLLRTAQPLYISRLSGQVIRGPLGENQ